ncbi:sterol regulatory element-binding protein [Pseudoscourfieldia marina]
MACSPLRGLGSVFVLVVALAGFTSGQHHPREERHPNFQHQVAAGVAAGSNPRHHQGPLGEIENIQLKFEGPTPVLYALPKAVPGPTDRCRFTKGGAHIITDERGNTCARSEWNPSSGCCPAAGQPPPACAALEAGTDAKLDMGDAGACEANTKCCGRYETCTACCLGQVRKLADEAKDESTDGQTRASKSLPPLSVEHSSMWNKWIESVGVTADASKGYPPGSVLIDPWEYCAVKCRTQAFMTVHENAFRHSDFRYCFGELDDKGLTPLWSNEEMNTRLQGFQKHQHMPKDAPTPGRMKLEDWSEEFAKFGHSADPAVQKTEGEGDRHYADHQFNSYVAPLPKTWVQRWWNTWSIFINGFFPKTASHSPHLAPILVALFIFVSFCLTAMVCVVWSLLSSVY